MACFSGYPFWPFLPRVHGIYTLYLTYKTYKIYGMVSILAGCRNGNANAIYNPRLVDVSKPHNFFVCSYGWEGCPKLP
jgi:hypothetical protein